MRKKNKIFIAVIALIMCLALSVGVVFAWWYGQTVNDIYTYSGNIDLEVEMYGGRDYNFDGVLDGINLDWETNPPATSEIGELDLIPLITTGWARADWLNESTGAYRKLNITRTYNYEDIWAGRSVTYKIVLVNNSETTGAKVSVNIADLRDYFYTGLASRTIAGTPTRGYMDTLWANYTANNTNFPLPSTLATAIHDSTVRLLFAFTDIAVRVYAPAGDTNDFNHGFSVLKYSSVPAEVTSLTPGGGGVEAIETTPTVIADYNLSNFSMGEKFIEDVNIPAGMLMEIDFKISNLQDTRSISNYMERANEYFGERTQQLVQEYLDERLVDASAQSTFAANYKTSQRLTTTPTYAEVIQLISTDYIGKMVQNEVDFLFDSSLGSAEDDYILTINYFEIRGTQVVRELD